MTLAPRSLLALLVLDPAIRPPTRVSLTLFPPSGMNACPPHPGYETTERVATNLTPSFVAHRPQVSVPTENNPITRARAIQYPPLPKSGKRKSVICEPKSSATRDEVLLVRLSRVSISALVCEVRADHLEFRYVF